jgi:hypothetical protein
MRALLAGREDADRCGVLERQRRKSAARIRDRDGQAREEEPNERRETIVAETAERERKLVRRDLERVICGADARRDRGAREVRLVDRDPKRLRRAALDARDGAGLRAQDRVGDFAYASCALSIAWSAALRVS